MLQINIYFAFNEFVFYKNSYINQFVGAFSKYDALLPKFVILLRFKNGPKLRVDLYKWLSSSQIYTADVYFIYKKLLLLFYCLLNACMTKEQTRKN